EHRLEIAGVEPIAVLLLLELDEAAADPEAEIVAARRARPFAVERRAALVVRGQAIGIEQRPAMDAVVERRGHDVGRGERDPAPQVRLEGERALDQLCGGAQARVCGVEEAEVDLALVDEARSRDRLRRLLVQIDAVAARRELECRTGAYSAGPDDRDASL